MGSKNARPWEKDVSTDVYKPKTDGYRVWLFGDSILDNSYWNNVEANMTSEQLKKMLPNVEVKDRATEELDAMSMLSCLQRGQPVRVRGQYVDHRNNIGCPYDEAPKGVVDIDPEFGPKDFIFLSVGGNDFALRGEMDPVAICDYVKQVINYYKAKGVKPERMFYLTPYPPTGLMKFAVCITARRSLSAIYQQCLEVANQTCAEEGISCIPLDHFGDDERANPGTGIPEPTPRGAWVLAKLI